MQLITTTLMTGQLKKISESYQKDIKKFERFRPHQTLLNILVSAKDRVPPKTRTGDRVVYSIPCGDCTAAYIGQTKRSITRHLKEHKRGLITYNAPASAIAEHAMITSHTINWTDTDFLTTNS